MKKLFFILVLSVFIFVFGSGSEAGVYETSADNAVQWIEEQQNIDGSWGGDEKVKPIRTTEAVAGLRSFYRHSTHYYRGMAWLENHDFSNLDYKARKVIALLAHGDDAQALVNDLLASQRTSFSNTAGWGLSAFYEMAPLDTAFELKTLSQTTWNNHEPVLSYLRTTQNGDGGWAVAEEGISDVLTTVQVVQALCLYQSCDPNLYNDVIAPAEIFLNNNVNTGSPVLIKANTVLALWPNSRYPSKAVELLDSLTTSQDPGGHWENDVYTTASVVRAISVVLGKDPEAQSALSGIADAGLRSGVNTSLDKNEADALTAGEMETLMNLNGAGRGISDLTGIENAVNLGYADLRNNEITSLLPLMALSNPETITVLLSGNPLSNTEDADGDGYSDLAELNAGTNPLDAASFPAAPHSVPAMSPMGGLLAVLLLLGLGVVTTRKGSQEMKTLLIILMLFSAFPAMGIAEQSQNKSHGLKAKRIEMIQSISKHILSVRKNKHLSDELQQTKDQLIALRKELMKLSPCCDGKKNRLIIQLKNGEQKKIEPKDFKRTFVKNKIENILSQLKQKRKEISDSYIEKINKKYHMMAFNRVKTIETLEKEVEDVLMSSNDEDRFKKIQELINRLEIKPLVRSDEAPKTPGISTITRHR